MRISKCLNFIILICNKVIMTFDFRLRHIKVHHFPMLTRYFLRWKLTFIPRQLQGSNCLYIKSVHLRFNKSIWKRFAASKSIWTLLGVIVVRAVYRKVSRYSITSLCNPFICTSISLKISKTSTSGNLSTQCVGQNKTTSY